MLYDLEQAVADLEVHASVVRAAYYMSNWDSALGTAREEGVVHTFFPRDFPLPMVAPADLGRVAARLLTTEVDHTGVHYVEGPAAYSPGDVARAFAEALGRDVRTVEVPRSEWQATFRSLGFSAAAAASYARMTGIALDGTERPEAPERGRTTLTEYVSEVLRRA